MREERQDLASCEAPKRSGPDLSVRVHGLSFANPVLAASGTFGYGIEQLPFMDLSLLGGFVTKGLSLLPKKGNPPPRIWETPAGMLNSIGLENVGVERFRSDLLPELADVGTVLVCNFFGSTEEDYVACAGKLGQEPRIDLLEMNLSCPNVKAGGIHFGTDPALVERLCRRVKEVASRPLWVKLSPLSHGLVSVAEACARGGADGLTLVNTIPGMAVDPLTRKPRLGGIVGGLSGPAVKPVALKAVFEVFRAGLGLPIAGVGGIGAGTDVVEFLLAGASLVQVGTQNLVDMESCFRILDELASFLSKERIPTAAELVGGIRLDG